MILLILTYFLANIYGLEFHTFPITDSPPNPRKGFIMEAIPSLNSMMIFGGYENRESIYNDIWQFSISSNTWNALFDTNNDSPGIYYLEGRYGGGGFYRYKSEEYCIWGGRSSQGILNDLWCFHIKYFTWRGIKINGNTIANPGYKIGYTSWNETGITMFAIFGGISTDKLSYDLLILNSDTWEWKIQQNNGEVPETQENPIIFYYSNCIYTIGGIASGSEDPYKSVFYQYNLTTQMWKNITNNGNLFTFRSHAKGALINNDFYLFFGLEANSMKELATCYKVSLEDPNFAWSFIPISGDKNDIIRRSSYGLGVLHEKVYLFGGTRDLDQKNSLIIFDMTKNPIEYEYFMKYSNPGSRMYHSLNVVGGHMLLFGGDRKGEKLNDLWELDLKTLTWTFLNPGGEIPIGRSHHASASNGDILIIWGGSSSQGYLNDAYIYNILTNMWYMVDYSSRSVPSPRIGACMGMDYSIILIYGGITYNGLSDEIWYLDLGTKSYIQLKSTNDGPGPLYLAACRCSSDRLHRLFVNGGIGPNEVPSNAIYIFNKNYMNWTKLYHDEDNLEYTRGYTKIFKVNNRYVYFGGESIDSPDNSCYYWNQTSNTFYKIGIIPRYIYAAAQECFGTSIYIHGGGAAMGENFRWTVPVSNLLYVDLMSACGDENPCTWAWCSSGTYLSNNVCEICPSGTYQPYYGGTCLECPKGTYYSGIGATSRDQCYPCNDGTYNPNKGASFCFICPPGATCPAGSSNYFYKLSKNYDTSIQPNLLSDRSRDSQAYSNEAQIAIGIVGLFLLAIILIIANRMNLFNRIDLYKALHNHILETPMVLKKTRIGGIFSLIFIILALMIIISILIDYSINNESETKSLVPLVVVNHEVSKFVTDLKVQVKAIGYGAPCIDDHGNCADTISISTNNFHGNWDKILCISSDFGCELKINCYNCEIGTGAYMDFSFRNSSSYTAWWVANITANSSIPNSLSSYETIIYPESGKIFRGPTPTILTFGLTPSYFQNTDSGLELTGYHIFSYGTQNLGSQCVTKELATSYNLYLNINFSKDTNCLITTRSRKQTWIQLISALLGCVFGLMGGIGGAMSFVEDQANIARDKLKVKEKWIKTKEECEMIGTMLECKTLSKLDSENSFYDMERPTDQRTIFDSDFI